MTGRSYPIRPGGYGRPPTPEEEAAQLWLRLDRFETIHVARPAGVMAAWRLEQQRLVEITVAQDGPLAGGMLLVRRAHGARLGTGGAGGGAAA